MKHVGLNVAADLLFTATYTGVNAGQRGRGGRGMHSITRTGTDDCQAAHVPVLEPADSRHVMNILSWHN
ncbi:MAG: hypothetical protein ACLUO4_00920 [Christensenellales bacterium]